MSRSFRVLLLVLFLLFAHDAAAQKDPGILILAPDRGFLGNDEVRDVVASLRDRLPGAEIAFATTENTRENIERPVARLRLRDPRLDVVVLPLFMSTHEALYERASDVLVGMSGVTIAEPFGASYLAEELLFDRVEALLGDGAAHGSHGGGAPHLILLADGAGSDAAAERIRGDLEPMVRRTLERFGLEGGEIAVLHDRSAAGGGEAFSETMGRIRAAAAQHDEILLVPMNFGPRLTTIMSQWAWTQMGLRGVTNLTAGDPDLTNHPDLERWMLRTATAYSPLSRDEIGVIFVPHGSEFNWNETMREGLAPLREDYATEDAFSMVDPYVVERAVRRLEEKGMKAAVLVRIFSLESSFHEQAEYVLGLRREPPAGGHMGMPLDRIESRLLFHTLGGVEAHPRFAEALRQRAREISTDPANETVILLAHGTGEDADNARWMDNLASIADHIREQAEEPYRDVKIHTWREDWPEKRAVTIPQIRAMIETANENGGTALVIPVRTNDQGPARTLVPDIEYRYGHGFSPHPEFTAWIRDQIEEGILVLTDPSLRASLLAGN